MSITLDLEIIQSQISQIWPLRIREKLRIRVFERNIEKNTHEEDTSDRSTEEKS